jgi:hypothetical protein
VIGAALEEAEERTMNVLEREESRMIDGTANSSSCLRDEETGAARRYSHQLRSGAPRARAHSAGCSPARGIREAYGSSVSRLSNGTGLPVPADLRRSALRQRLRAS